MSSAPHRITLRSETRQRRESRQAEHQHNLLQKCNKPCAMRKLASRCFTDMYPGSPMSSPRFQVLDRSRDSCVGDRIVLQAVESFKTISLSASSESAGRAMRRCESGMVDLNRSLLLYQRFNKNQRSPRQPRLSCERFSRRGDVVAYCKSRHIVTRTSERRRSRPRRHTIPTPRVFHTNADQLLA